jgi:tripartite-type tricarboxylate transporter receptor subunit TctC
VDNKAGAAGTIAATVVASAPADGYTLQVVTAPEVSINPFVRDNLAVRLDRDFVPVTMTTVNRMVLAANINAPFKTLPELIAAAKAHPGDISYSTAGAGSSPHLTTELFAKEAHISLQHIPYKGGAPASVAVVGGEVPLGAMAISAALPFVQAGKLRVLGITGTGRFAPLPDWPTLEENGIDSAAQSSVWTGVFVKKGTPVAIQRKLDATLREVLADPVFVKKLQTLGGEPGNLSFDKFAAFIDAEMKRNEPVVRGLHLLAD